MPSVPHAAGDRSCPCGNHSFQLGKYLLLWQVLDGGLVMDRTAAEQALRAAESASSKVLARGRWHPKALLALGVLEAVILLTGGFASVGMLLMPGSLVPLFVFIIYSATRPVVGRHQRARYAILGASVGLVIAIAVPLGQVSFAGNPAWWVPAALFSAIPFALAAWFETRGRR